MSLIGLDLNATRVRAVGGPAEMPPRSLALDGRDNDLPLALSLEGRAIEIGRAGVGLCRRLPHLACVDFLAHLGGQRQWSAGRHRLDATAALTRIFQHLQARFADAQGIVLAVPSYLNRAQAGLLAQLAVQAKLPVLGSVATPLAVALAGQTEQSKPGDILVVDLDGQALTWTALTVDDRQIKVVGEQSLPQLSLRVWKDRLLNSIADRCIRHSRRDPRESAGAEQMLYEQFDGTLDAYRQGKVVELVIRASQWCQHLLVRPEELEGFCAALVRQTLEGMQTLQVALRADRPPRAVYVTTAAGRLPGLLTALQEHTGERTRVLLLAPDAVGLAAHRIATQIHGGSLSHGHRDVTIPGSWIQEPGSKSQGPGLRGQGPGKRGSFLGFG